MRLSISESRSESESRRAVVRDQDERAACCPRRVDLLERDVEAQGTNCRVRAAGFACGRRNCHSIRLVRARCGIHTPLGWPVDPEV